NRAAGSVLSLPFTAGKHALPRTVPNVLPTFAATYLVGLFALSMQAAGKPAASRAVVLAGDGAAIAVSNAQLNAPASPLESAAQGPTVLLTTPKVCSFGFVKISECAFGLPM